MHILGKATAKYSFTRLIALSVSLLSATLLSGCITQSFENNEPIVINQANRDEMAVTRISLGLGYLRMGDMSQAKLNLEKAKKFSPGLVQVHTAFAHYYETVGENKLAIESFEHALAIKADSADTLNNYGVFLCRQNQVAEAEIQFLKAIAVPSYLLVAQSYQNLSSCYLQINDFDKATMYLHKAILHSPNRTTTLLQMVRLQYAMANFQDSQRFLQKFERNSQHFSADFLALAYKLYRKLGERHTADNYATMLVKMYPQSWESKQYLLNGLEFIESDALAKKYQLTQEKNSSELSSINNKRVVKLSPKTPINNAYSNSSNKTIVTSTAHSQPSLATSAKQIKKLSPNPRAPVSTQPIAAKVDKALPQALAQAKVETLVNDIEQTAQQNLVHTVTTGESLYSIAIKYNVKLQNLRQWNNITQKNEIHVGDNIYVTAPNTVKYINE